MSDAGVPPEEPAPVRKVVLVVLAVAITLLFLWMIRAFLIALFLAAILAGSVRPAYKRVLGWVRGRRAVAAGLTVTILSVLGIVPLLGFGIVVAQQAVDLGRAAGPWVREQMSTPSILDELSLRFPELESLRPYRQQITEKVGELGALLGTFAVDVATSAAQGAVQFFLLLFVTLYATFYFLTDGPRLLQKLLYYSPLPPEDENKMLGRFLSVARATVKGTLVIAVVQGLLGGLAFWVAGIAGAAFWATAMGVLSVIPGLGPTIVWVPAVVYLFAVQQTTTAVGLLLWCALVVGSIDNFLRPWLVGKDTKLPDLLVLVSTLGGLVLFGAVGFIIGPIVAALFVTVWDIYGEVFRRYLPEPSPLSVPLSVANRPSEPSPPTERSERRSTSAQGSGDVD